MAKKINRKSYAAMYGPTTGDRVRLADTDLILEIEKGNLIFPLNIDEKSDTKADVVAEGPAPSP